MFIGRIHPKLNNKGYSSLIFVLILCLALVIVLEIYRDYEIHRVVKTTVDRVANVALNYSISADTREDIIIVDEDIARNCFYELIANELKLDSNFNFANNYHLSLHIDIDTSPPTMKIEGIVTASPFLLSNLLNSGIQVNIPFKTVVIIQDMNK